jgi:hypothetical protein
MLIYSCISMEHLNIDQDAGCVSNGSNGIFSHYIRSEWATGTTLVVILA